MLGLLPFFPFTAAIALTLHFLTCKDGPLFSDISCPFFFFYKSVYFDFHLSQISTSSSSAAPPSSVFFLGGSMEFPNLSFSSELTDSTSPQFRLQAQALNHYVSGTLDPESVIASPSE